MIPEESEQRDCAEDNKTPAPTIRPADLARIGEGITADEQGDFATEEEVLAEFARWRSLRGESIAPIAGSALRVSESEHLHATRCFTEDDSVWKPVHKSPALCQREAEIVLPRAAHAVLCVQFHRGNGRRRVRFELDTTRRPQQVLLPQLRGDRRSESTLEPATEAGAHFLPGNQLGRALIQ